MNTSDTPGNGDSSEEELFQHFADAVNDEDVEAQEDAMLQVLQHLAETQDEEPSAWLKAMTEAHQCEAAFDWTGAEAAYKRAINASAGQFMLCGKAHAQLSALYYLVGLDELGWEATQEATRVIRREGVASLTTFQLQSEASHYLKAGDLPRAWSLLNEAWGLIDDEPMHHLELAYALLLRAQCHIQEDNLNKAEADLDYAWELLEPHARTFFAAGWQGGLAQWWSIRAELKAHRQEWNHVVTCWREAVKLRRVISQLPQLEGPYKFNALAKVLLELGRALHQVGDASASHCYEESHTIRRTIGLPPLAE